MIWLAVYLVGFFITFCMVMYDEVMLGRDIRISDLLIILLIACFSWFTVMIFIFDCYKDIVLIKGRDKK